MNVYYRYWGKAQAKEGDTECHLLAYHNLNVAAVGWLLLAPDKPVTQRLAAQLDLASERLRQLLVFWLGQHDIGKFSRAFQGHRQRQARRGRKKTNRPARTHVPNDPGASSG